MCATAQQGNHTNNGIARNLKRSGINYKSDQKSLLYFGYLAKLVLFY